MSRVVIVSIGAMLLSVFPSTAQQTSSSLPSAPTPHTVAPSLGTYLPPTQRERLSTYLRHTYSLYSILEAGIRGGMDQALDRPSQWPEGGQGYADRFGSAMGEIAVRGTAEYGIADVFREDLRFIPCASPCSESAAARALEDTFTARKGDNGRRAFSFARLLGPIAGGAVAKETWYPAAYGNGEILRQAGISYAFGFVRNYIREVTH